MQENSGKSVWEKEMDLSVFYWSLVSGARGAVEGSSAEAAAGLCASGVWRGWLCSSFRSCIWCLDVSFWRLARDPNTYFC